MAVIEGGVSSVLAGVGAQVSAPLHTCPMPHDYGEGGHYRVGALTGTIAAALGANSELFQFRYLTSASRLAIVYRVAVSAGANVAATAAALASFRMTAARGWTADGTGGGTLTLTGDNAQMRSSMGESEVGSIRIATTAALGAGTKSLDASDLANVAFGIGTGILTTGVNFSLLPHTLLFDPSGEGSHPLVLANQEGFIIRTGAAFPATMTWHLAVNVLWAEVPAF